MQEGGLYGLPPNGKHLHQRLLPAIHQFSEPERQGNSSCEPCYHCPYFEEEGRDQSCVSPHKTISLVSSHSLNWLNGRGKKISLVQIVGMLVRKNREVKKCCVLEEECVIGERKDFFFFPQKGVIFFYSFPYFLIKL